MKQECHLCARMSGGDERELRVEEKPRTIYEWEEERKEDVRIETPGPRPQPRPRPPPPPNASASLLDMMAGVMVCGDEESEACSECAAETADGVRGHIPWDEVEMMKHGWMDTSGRHWTKSNALDELSKLQHGLCDRQGKTVPWEGEAMPSKSLSESSQLGTDGHIRFAQGPVDVISFQELSETEVEMAGDGEERKSQDEETPLLTLL